MPDVYLRLVEPPIAIVLARRSGSDPQPHPLSLQRFSSHWSIHGHCSDISVSSGDHHRVVRSIQLVSLRTFSFGDSSEGRAQDRRPAKSLRAAPTGRVDTAVE